MKYRHILISLGLGAALLSGCGTSGDTENAIVGTWHKNCYLPTGSDQYRIKDLVFKSNNTGHLKKTYFDNEDCTLNPRVEEADFAYEVGEKTLGDDGKEAYELNLSDEAWVFYRMFRFKSNGNFLASGSSETRDGKSKAQRANHFNPNWTGYVKQ